MTPRQTVESALTAASQTISRMAQRQPHIKYDHSQLWDAFDAAKKALIEMEKQARHDRTCLACGGRHPFNPDGTPVGGALPCGH